MTNVSNTMSWITTYITTHWITFALLAICIWLTTCHIVYKILMTVLCLYRILLEVLELKYMSDTEGSMWRLNNTNTKVQDYFSDPKLDGLKEHVKERISKHPEKTYLTFNSVTLNKYKPKNTWKGIVQIFSPLENGTKFKVEEFESGRFSLGKWKFLYLLTNYSKTYILLWLALLILALSMVKTHESVALIIVITIVLVFFTWVVQEVHGRDIFHYYPLLNFLRI